MTYAESLDIATCFIVFVCLWVRRGTWRYRWEQAKTIGLTLIAAGAVLKAPPISWLIDRDVLHGLYLLVANILIVGGIAAFAYSAECKLRPDEEICRWRITAVLVPLTLGVGTMIGLFAAGAYSTLDRPFGFSTYTTAYWLVYDILTVYLLMLFAYALGSLFCDPPSRRSAGLYLLAIGLSLIGATCRALLVTVDDHVPDVLLLNAALTANNLAIIILAVGAAHTWRKRLRHSTKPQASKPIPSPCD